jgi:HK97 family phage major capsid protein
MPDNDLLERGRARLVEIKTRCDEITRDGFAATGGGIVVNDDAAKEFKSLIEESTKVRETLGWVTEAEALGRFLDAPANGDAATRQSQIAVRAEVPAQWKSLGQQFIESAEFKARDGGHMRTGFEVKGELGAWFLPQGLPADTGPSGPGGMEQKDLYTAMAGTQTSYTFGRTEQAPMVMRPMRSARVRDLFPSAQTTANLIQYVRSLGFLGGVNAARPVPEREGTAPNLVFGLKPHTSIEFQPAEAPIRTIAHYEVAHRNVLDDEPQLRSIIDGELLYGLRLAEDSQLLNGDGLGENVLGLLNTPGIQNYPGSATPLTGDTYIDAIRRAATRIYLAYYEPTGIIVHPFDWEKIETTKDENGQYIATVSVTSGAEQRLWRLPVVSTPVMPEGTAMVGAFGLGCKIYDRMQSNIRVAEQDADLFRRNALTILAESRLGLVCPRPESLVKVDLEAAAP